MQNKLQELTDRLYNEGLSKGKQEGEELLAKAKVQADEMIAKAQAEAAQQLRSRLTRSGQRLPQTSRWHQARVLQLQRRISRLL